MLIAMKQRNDSGGSAPELQSESVMESDWPPYPRNEIRAEELLRHCDKRVRSIVNGQRHKRGSRRWKMWHRVQHKHMNFIFRSIGRVIERQPPKEYI